MDVLDGYTERGEVAGLVWGVALGDRVVTGVSGDAAPDSIFRIASMTKPLTAVAALQLVEACEVRLDEPVDPWLPELADGVVLVHPEGPPDETVPAERPISLRDLLTFRCGYGMSFDFSKPQAHLELAAELGFPVGPPAPAHVPEADEVMRRMGQLPLACQPGTTWLYNTGSDLLGVLIERVTSRSLDDVFRERIFEPLGLTDTGFSVPSASLDRFGPCHLLGEDGARALYDPADGQWASPPAFRSGGGGLVSTVPDYLRFARMLLAGGTLEGRRVLAPSSVAAMTTDHLEGAVGPDAAGATGWGFGVDVQRRRIDHTRSPGSYSWTGGLGSSWVNDPAAGLCGVLLTTQMFQGPWLPTVHRDFWTLAYTNIGA